MLDHERYLNEQNLGSQVSITEGRWRYGVYANFIFTTQEASSIASVAGTVATQLGMISGFPVATITRAFAYFFAGSFAYCNRNKSGVIVDTGTYFAAPYIYCRPR